MFGYIQNSKGIFLFYEIPYKKYKSKSCKKNTNYGGLLFMKFVTLKRILNFPIHNSVTYLFFNNNKLIYLKNKDDVNIQIPTIGYYTESKELLPFISVMGIKSSSSKTFGAYYYFQNYQNLFRGSWSSNYKKREIQNKVITDDNGLLKMPWIC